ncbi:hypothetical protein J4438_03145 [Candidatus Woesearchaeota archaeon]|nr:hypothetical protein [Candidatus Woesearchaeota archaeon]
MAFSCFSPSWFFGWDVGFELVFAIILLTISIFAFKAYKISDQKKIKYIGYGFLFIGISYIIQSVFNFLIISKLDDNLCRIILLKQIVLLEALALYFHLTLWTIGLMFLVYMTFRSENKLLLVLLNIIALLAIFMSENIIFTFYLISSAIVIYLVCHFMSNYLKNNKKNALLIAIAFLFLLVSEIHFLFSMDHTKFYVIGHIFELISYLIILFNFYVIHKNESKKR